MPFSKDLRDGLDEEDLLLDQIKDHFCFYDLVKTHNYHPFDYSNDKWWIELKKRNCMKDRYETTLIPYSKMLALEKSGMKGIYVFSFTDGIYYIENDQMFYTIDYFCRNRRSGYDDKRQKYVFIPTEQLKTF